MRRELRGLWLLLSPILMTGIDYCLGVYAATAGWIVGKGVTVMPPDNVVVVAGLGTVLALGRSRGRYWEQQLGRLRGGE